MLSPPLARTPLEFRALRYLVHHKTRVVSQGELAAPANAPAILRMASRRR